MGYSPWGHKELDMTEVTGRTHTHAHTHKHTLAPSTSSQTNRHYPLGGHQGRLCHRPVYKRLCQLWALSPLSPHDQDSGDPGLRAGLQAHGLCSPDAGSSMGNRAVRHSGLLSWASL